MIDAIPQASPGAAASERGVEYRAAISRVLDSGHYILGEEVEQFERDFAAYIGVEHCVGVASGTDALELALRAVGVGPNDGVITVSHTAVATVMAILRIGALPILVDIDERRYTLDPARLEDALRTIRPGIRVKAVVPVHLYGATADMRSIVEIADRAGLFVVEDCAQAHGAELDGRRAGSLGAAAAFSFYPTKNLGALGDAGAVVTDDAGIAEQVRRLRQYGWRERFVSEEVGVNSRLDALHAAILRVNLAHLDVDNARRRSIAAVYDEGLAGSSVVLPEEPEGTFHVFHQYVIRTTERDALRAWCTEEGVGTAIHYPVPVHRQPAFRDGLALTGDMRVTERLASEILSLPMFPQLAPRQARDVVDVVRGWTAQPG